MNYPRIFFALALALFSLPALCQNWSHYKWDTTSKMDNSVFTEANEFFKKRYKDNIYIGNLDQKSADYHTAWLYTDYLLGNFYKDFYGYETYIRDVLAEVVKDTAVVNNMHVYFYYDPEYNASMDAFGNIRINVGLFNYINSEAELAGILAHEYGHFLNKDMINDHSASIQKESTADYQAIKLIKTSKYSTKGLSNAFKTFKRFEIKEELLVGNNKVRSVTHPDPGDRLRQVKILSKDSSNIGKKLFVVDSLAFTDLKRIASQESFNIMLGYRDYQNIIELAFTHYLYFPNDHENLALLNEGLRRYLLVNPREANKQFIIGSYKGKGARRSDNYKYVDEDKTSILNYLNKGLLHLPGNDLSKIKATDLLDSIKPKFRTNEEARDYFEAKAAEVNCKPCLLSNVFKNEKQLLYSEEAFLNNTVFDCSDFLNSLKQPAGFSDGICILELPSIDNLEYFKINSPTPYTEFLQTYLKTFKESTGFKNVYLINELPFKDQHDIQFINSIAESLVDPGLYWKAITTNVQAEAAGKANMFNNQFVTKYDRQNWRAYAPESYGIFSKYKVKNIFIVNFDINVFETSAAMIGGYGFGVGVGKREITSRSWKLKKLSLEEKNLTNIMYQHNIAVTKKSREECVKECTTSLKWFLAGNR